ncbi:MAG: hypothetical protein AB1456_05775, partial [Thermodesulfobacteriota bacterium]
TDGAGKTDGASSGQPAVEEQPAPPAPTADTPGEPESLDTSGVGPVIKVIPGSFDRKKIKEEKL